MNTITKILGTTALVTASLTATANASYTCINNVEQVNGLFIYTSSFCGQTSALKDMVADFESDGVLPEGLTFATPETLMQVTVVANTPDRNREPEPEPVPVAVAPVAPVAPIDTVEIEIYNIDGQMDKLESSLSGSEDIHSSLQDIALNAEGEFVGLFQENIRPAYANDSTIDGTETFYIRAEAYNFPVIMRRAQTILIDTYTTPNAHAGLLAIGDKGHEALSLSVRLHSQP